MNRTSGSAPAAPKLKPDKEIANRSENEPVAAESQQNDERGSHNVEADDEDEGALEGISPSRVDG